MAGNLQEDSRRNLVWKLNGVILPAFGNLQAIQISPERIDKYVNDRLTTVKRTTVHRELTDISAILNWAAERQYISHNPIANYRKPSRDDEVIQPPTQEEIAALMAVARPWLVRALALSYYTGIRPGRVELLRRRWSDVNWTAQTIFVESARKGGLKTRQIHIHEDLFSLLKAWFSADKSLKVMPWAIIHYKSQPIGSLKRSWSTAKRKAGITRRLRPYDLRHAFATYALSQSADLKSVSEILGHSRPDTTIRVYQHSSAELQRAAVQKLPSITLSKGNQDDRQQPAEIKQITRRE
jgi:integrase